MEEKWTVMMALHLDMRGYDDPACPWWTGGAGPGPVDGPGVGEGSIGDRSRLPAEATRHQHPP